MMSFTVQPAPRMTMAPMVNSTVMPMPVAAVGLASAIAHQHGSSSSQMPVGRSSRASLK